MKRKKWFRAKNYGWGWYPSSWQGWTVLTAYLIIEVWNFIRLDSVSRSNSDTIRPFVIQSIVLTLMLIAICIKTGEKPRWRWGK